MTTRLAKSLVLVNLFVGLALFTWALSIYANRVDYFDRKDADPPVEGRFTALRQQINELNEAAKTAQRLYAFKSDQARGFEAERERRLAILNRRLDTVRRGNDPAVVFRQQELLRDPRFPGLINVNQEGPILKGVRDNDLQGLGFLQAQMATAVQEEVALRARIKEARETLDQLSTRVEAVQAEVFNQKRIRENLQQQREYLADLVINWDERLRVLERRRTQLQVRLEQAGVNENRSSTK
jgi:hypothetical protein